MTEAASTPTQNRDQPIKASELDPKFKYELQKIHGSEKILNVSSAEHAHPIALLHVIVTVTAREPSYTWRNLA